MLPVFTLITNPEKSELDNAFVHGHMANQTDNISSVLEEVKTNISKDYKAGVHGGFWVNVTHQKRDRSTPRIVWNTQPPFMRFKGSGDIKIYGDSAMSAREIGKYISKMANKLNFCKCRFMLCTDEDGVLTPIITGNKAFLNGLVRQMSSYYEDKKFVVTAYTLNVE